ncbi:Putative ribonuclease H protein At1g65750 [Linum perenne]
MGRSFNILIRLLLGGIIRNSHSRLLAVFSSNLGSCTVIRAELRGVAIGLNLAWDIGVRKILLQSDSMAVVGSIHDTPDEDARHSATVLQIHELLNREWEVKTSHVFREGNRVADLLLEWGTHVNFPLSHLIEYAILSNCIGINFPRAIPIN